MASAGLGSPPYATRYLAYLQHENIPYLVAGEERVDLHYALEKLGSQLKVKCVMSAAGGKLNGALLRAGLVDEVKAALSGLEGQQLLDIRVA